MQWRGVRRLSVCLSVRPSVNFCANRFFSYANGRIATKLAHDGLQVSVHPGCAQGQGQGQRSRDTGTFLDSWNELLRHWRSGFCYVTTMSNRSVGTRLGSLDFRIVSNFRTASCRMQISSLRRCQTVRLPAPRQNPVVYYAKYTPPTPTRLNSTVASRRRRRCVLGCRCYANVHIWFHSFIRLPVEAKMAAQNLFTLTYM